MENENKEIEEAAEATPSVEEVKPTTWDESKWDDGSELS